MSRYDISRYPAGIPNPRVPRVHAWRGGPLNEGSRFHGGNWIRPMARPTYNPQRMAGLGDLDMRVDTLEGMFATTGYGGGMFNQRLSGLGAYKLTEDEQKRLTCHQQAELAFQQRLDASIQGCREHMDWMDDEGIGTEADRMEAFNACVGQQNALETARLTAEKEACGPDVAIPVDDNLRPPTPAAPAPPAIVYETITEGPDWTTWLFWGGVGAATVAAGYGIHRAMKKRK